VRKEYLAKINNLPNHHGAGPNAAASVASAYGAANDKREGILGFPR